MVGRNGRVMSGQVGLCRLKSGEVGRKNFLRPFFAVTVLHQFFRFRRRLPVLAAPPRLSHRRRIHAGRLTVGSGCPVWTLKVGLSRVRAGSIPLPRPMRLTSPTLPRCLCWVPGRLQSRKGLPRLQNPCQRETWLDNDETLSLVPCHMPEHCHYITVLDAIALPI